MTTNTNHEHPRKSMGMHEYHVNQLIVIRIHRTQCRIINNIVKSIKNHKHRQFVFVNNCNHIKVGGPDSLGCLDVDSLPS